MLPLPSGSALSFTTDSAAEGSPWLAAADDPAGLIVQYLPGVTPAQQAAALAAIGAGEGAVLREGDAAAGPLATVPLPPGADPAAAAALLALQPGVAFAEPDARLAIAATSNDPRYVEGALWGLYGDATAIANAFGSQAGEAWAAGHTGATRVVVGVVDSGIDYTHVDLYLNVWLNQGEIPSALRAALTDVDRDGLITFRDLNAAANRSWASDLNRNGRIDAGDLLADARWENGRDEDGNGYRDDLVGWDFANNDNDPFDDNGHGTHVAGTIGATGGNGTGIAGVAWTVQMVGLKFLDARGGGLTSNAVRALDYYTAAAVQAAAAHRGEDFVATNNSWGGGSTSQALADAIARGARQDILFVAAAGNGGADGIGDNNDRLANWPSNYDTRAAAGYDAVIAVAALTSTGARAGYSNYGAGTVDLAAPGSDILSTLPGDRYGSYSGTSMATPHVTGAIALYAAAHPEATAAQIRAALLGSTAATESVAGGTATGGRLDAGALLDGPAPPPPPPQAAVAITRAYDNAGSVTGNLAAGAVTDDRTPTLYGTLSATLGSGEVVAVYRDGVRAGQAAVTGTGWSFAETSPLEAGAHAYAARVERGELAGTFSAAFGLTIDLTSRIFGTAGSDALTGTALADILCGVPATGSALGRGTVDRLTGRAGTDTFVLGDARGLFYDDGKAGSAGTADYAQILDFQRGDRVQLADDVGAYFAAPLRLGGQAGLGLYADLNRNGRFDAADELVGHLANVTTLAPGDLVFA